MGSHEYHYGDRGQPERRPSRGFFFLGRNMDLFNSSETPIAKSASSTYTSPLSSRMRPQNLDEIIGQDHLVAEGSLLRRAIDADRFNSLIFYGPPGCGKTSLAEVIACTTSQRFERASGVLSNVSILRKILEEAAHRKKMNKTRTILFIDEIHRFSKSQQDVLLPYVETGDVTLIGATTHNPHYFINAPLNSRSQIFQLQALSIQAIENVLKQVVESPRGFDGNIRIDEEAITFIAENCEGDARFAINALEIAVLTTSPSSEDETIHITIQIAANSLQKKAVRYDRNEDHHYDTISAFIKSIRGSDPDAGIYWLAKMLQAGEDPRFIARRLVIIASEDVGNADPRALPLAVSAMQAAEFIGMPEARITLAQATTYLAAAPKSNASYKAICTAMEDIENGRIQDVPDYLQSGKKIEPATQAYKYAHDGDGHFVNQNYMQDPIHYYYPTEEGFEKRIKQRLDELEKRRNAST